jgi:hypothetical protein
MFAAAFSLGSVIAYIPGKQRRLSQEGKGSDVDPREKVADQSSVEESKDMQNNKSMKSSFKIKKSKVILERKAKTSEEKARSEVKKEPFTRISGKTHRV